MGSQLLGEWPKRPEDDREPIIRRESRSTPPLKSTEPRQDRDRAVPKIQVQKHKFLKSGIRFGARINRVQIPVTGLANKRLPRKPIKQNLLTTQTHS